MKKIPGPRGFIFIRLMRLFQRDSLRALEESYRLYGPIVKYPWPINTVLVFDPKIAKQVFIDKNQIYDKGTQTDTLRPVLGNGLPTNSDRESWLNNRVIISRELGQKLIKNFSGTMMQICDESLDTWQDGMSINPAETIRILTFKIAGRVLMASDLSAEDSKKVDEAVIYTSHLAHEHMFKLFPIPYWIPTPKNLLFWHHKKVLDDTVYRMIKNMRETGETSESTKSVLMSLTFALYPHSGLPLDDKVLRDEVLSLLIAGYETTLHTISWILGLLASHPEYQRQIQAELDVNPIIDSTGFTKTHPILHRGIIEGIRLYPAIPMVSRKSTVADHFGEYKIPAQTSIVISSWILQRDEKYWDDPKAFKPERFENVDPATIDSYAAFSKGSRRCVGELMSTFMTAVVLSSILKRFDLELEGEALPEAVSVVTLRAKKPFWIKIRKRSSK